MKIILIALMIFIIPVASEAEITGEKLAYELYFLHTLTNDWLQTREISKSPFRQEQNVILGRNPSLGDVDLYFASCALGHAVISYYLPEKYSKAWQFVWIGIQTNVITHNNNCGLEQKMGMSYHFKYKISF